MTGTVHEPNGTWVRTSSTVTAKQI